MKRLDPSSTVTDVPGTVVSVNPSNQNLTSTSLENSFVATAMRESCIEVMELLVYGLSILLFATTARCGSELEARTLAPRNTSVFHHRGFHNSIVLGNYLYIDGGEITDWNGAGSGLQASNPQAEGDIVTKPDNYTYSIDLTSSWTNSSVMLNSIKKAAPVLNNEALWLDASGQTFYAYDGAQSMGLYNWWEINPPNNAMWQFTPSQDSGQWEQAPIAASSNFSTLSRVTIGNYAYGNGLGFALGGVESFATYHYDFASIFDYVLVPGLVMYNDSSKEWYNSSSTGYSYYGFGSGGVAHFVPTFGDEGLLLVLGGWTTQTQQLVPMQSVSLYDPKTQDWQNQVATGDVPGEAASGCVVGLEGDDGTYEIFMYGGQVHGDVERTVENGVVYVLSLPSFHWSKQAASSTFGRYMHSCNVIGNRQLVTIGGVVIESGVSVDAFTVSGGSPDPWDQGIGIFDLTDMEWKSSYDPSAAAYVTPNIVKSYISENGRYPASWSNSVVEEWFKNPDPSGNGTPKTTTPTDHSSSGSSNAGAIAGGVVGAVLGLAIVAGITWFLRKRTRRQRATTYAYHQHQEDNQMNGSAFEEMGEGGEHEVDGSHAMAELPARNKPVEAPGQLHEAPGQFHELPGHFR